MNEAKMNENKFVMYEYLDVNVKESLVQLCSDCYRALGWNIINSSSGIDSVTLKMQRDRKIKNRVALYDLQRKCEEAFTNIEKLERSKMSKPMAVSLGVGIVGTIAITGSVFLYLAGKILGCIILAIPGFIGWGLPHYLYKKFSKRSAEEIKPMIDRNYDVIYEACEKATQLLS